MEVSYEKVLNELKRRVEFVISKYESVLSDNKDISFKLITCRQELDNSNNKIKELGQKIDNLQLTEAFKTSSDDVKEAKQNIGKLVKEIDKCIALLND